MNEKYLNLAKVAFSKNATVCILPVSRKDYEDHWDIGMGKDLGSETVVNVFGVTFYFVHEEAH
jgi:hypothetical protein